MNTFAHKSPPKPHTPATGHHAHFIGIAGIGMSATALLLRQLGWSVSGSDEGFYPPASEVLPAHGITISTPHAAANIPPEATVVVIGKHAKLTMENEEVAHAVQNHEKSIRSYPEVLAEVTKGRHNIVVAGSYGKSTTSSLLAWALLVQSRAENSEEPGYFLGALPKNLPGNASLGAQSQPFVLEGDEYPSSNTDDASKFLYYNPKSLVLTSAVHDHVNVFPTHEDYLKPFRQLVEKLPENGLFVVCKDEPFAMQLAEKSPCKTVTYALEDTTADYHAKNISYGDTTTYTLVGHGKELGAFTTQLLGKHNLQNMVGAAALLLEEQRVSIANLQTAFASFLGVVRRMDKLTATAQTPVYEGFGSSREKARAAIEAIQLHFPKRKLVIVFEPHTFSWRNRATLHWYDDVFAGASSIFLYKPPTHGAASHTQLSHDEITERVQQTGLPVTPIGQNAEADLAAITAEAGEDTVILLLTSGDLGGLIKQLISRLESQAAAA